MGLLRKYSVIIKYILEFAEKMYSNYWWENFWVKIDELDGKELFEVLEGLYDEQNAKELILGYEKIISSDLKDDILAVAILRTMRIYQQILQEIYFEYLSIPKGFWLKVHSAYKLSKDMDIAAEVEKIYKEIIVYHVLNPYQWRQKEQKDLLTFITSQSDKVKMGFMDEGNVYLVNLEQDIPPSAVELDDKGNENCVMIVQKEVKDLFDEKNKTLTSNMINVLQAQLSYFGVRSDDRQALEEEVLVEVFLGYDFLHKVLLNREGGSFSQLESSSYVCKMVDKSKQGMKLLWQGMVDENMSPGSALIFKWQNRWLIGCISWLQRLDKSQLYLGVKLLGENIEPVAMKVEPKGLLRSLFSKRDKINCFKVDKLDDYFSEQQLSSLPTLVTNIKNISRDDEIEVEHHKITLQEEIYSKGYLKQFLIAH